MKKDRLADLAESHAKVLADYLQAFMERYPASSMEHLSSIQNLVVDQMREMAERVAIQHGWGFYTSMSFTIAYWSERSDYTKHLEQACSGLEEEEQGL